LAGKNDPPQLARAFGKWATARRACLGWS
jgi:hypothetical protein